MPYLYIPPPVPALVRGLGALGCSSLSPAAIFQLATAAGFPYSTAVTMTALALRESGGCPTAHNYRAPGSNGPNDPGEDSYGLWQINIQSNPSFAQWDLTDPASNATAAFQIWGGNDANLNTAWYINRPGYREAYLAQLPAAQAAADAVSGGSVLQASVFPDLSNLVPGLDLTGISGGAIALGLGLLLAAMFIAEG